MNDAQDEDLEGGLHDEATNRTANASLPTVPLEQENSPWHSVDFTANAGTTSLQGEANTQGDGQDGEDGEACCTSPP